MHLYISNSVEFPQVEHKHNYYGTEIRIIKKQKWKDET